MLEKFDSPYNPQETESRIYKLWLDSGYFNPDKLPGKRKEHFTIVLPPPNVTGTLHIGHALEHSAQDALVRFNRMRGKKTLWLPGTDHAAIATQAKVEKDLYKKEKKTRHDLGRKAFVKMVEDFAKSSQDTIVKQLKRMGASLDWSREAYTLDKKRSLAVRTAFKNMYETGLIYRGNRIVNWDPKMQTTVSDDEIQWTEQKSPFYYIKYGPFTIGTARPETKFGDKYVVIHPDDKRYSKYKHGEKLEVEWMQGKITATIIKDKAVDPEFGSGVMTITPWHDKADFDIAERHKLDREQIIDFRGLLLPVAGEFAEEHIKKARPKIVEKLKSKGLLEKIDEHYVNRIATNSRGGGIIEPQIKEQWFVDASKKFKVESEKLKGIKKGQEISLKDLMRKVVESGQIKIIPERFEKIYYHWIDNLRDWNISRQIWYGHRTPVWYRAKTGHTSSPLSPGGRGQGEGDLRMGFHEEVVPQVLRGKTKTFRLRDHGFKVGDKVWFDNSQTNTIFGYGIVTKVEKTTIDKIDFKDKSHYKTYKNLDELLKAFKLRNPEKTFNSKSKAYLYEYKFTPKKVEKEEIFVGIKPPKNEGWTQDPDTLDTWFSSGLWSISTLGWPQKTSDLKNFHPTDVLNIGYDILFFWAARMILMTGFNYSEIPFKTIYIHGLVRDKDKKKMSKSKGNVVDPLGVADTYGTDALRMALIFSTAAGNDIPLDEQKIAGMKKFANKLWNISRFVLSNSQNLQTTSYKLQAISQADKDILKKLDQTVKDVTKHTEEFRLHEAAQSIYQFTWHEFADKYIETSKNQLKDEKLKENTLVILLNCLVVILKTLHPFMPFITEEIWSTLAHKPSRDRQSPGSTRDGKEMKQKDLLMVADWPD